MINQNFFIFTLVFCFLFSCSTERPEGRTEAEILYKEAEELTKNGRYILATEKLNRIRSKYPYSYYATYAELKSADVLFLQENYVEAAAAYIVFKDFHPKHKKSDYVVWKIGESYYNQIPSTFDRDLEPAFEAIKYYEELKRKFPSSENVKDAEVKITKCKDMIRNKEKYIADFYYKTDRYSAARFRYENIISDFDEPKLITHAIIRALNSSEEMGDPDYCEKKGDEFKSQIQADSKKGFERALKNCLKAERSKE